MILRELLSWWAVELLRGGSEAQRLIGAEWSWRGL
jgi:hypothetical protein